MTPKHLATLCVGLQYKDHGDHLVVTTLLGVYGHPAVHAAKAVVWDAPAWHQKVRDLIERFPDGAGIEVEENPHPSRPKSGTYWFRAPVLSQSEEA